jgi:hypothetical protein
MEVTDNRLKGKLRYSIEIGYARVTTWKILKDKMSFSNLRFANDAWFFAHAMSNFMAPIRN